MSGELILYTTDDGQARIQLRAQGGTVWITQAEIAELFQTTPQNVTLHIKSIYAEGELVPGATCKEHLQVRKEGKRPVQRSLKHYNLDMVLAVGYRVRSRRGTQFRQWATTHLREYLVKGFVLDDERLKHAGTWDYFDELLERIRGHGRHVARGRRTRRPRSTSTRLTRITQFERARNQGARDRSLAPHAPDRRWRERPPFPCCD